jgi:hypothetical protein
MKFHAAIRVLFVALVILLVLFTCSLIGGCEVLKNKRTISSDSTHVTKIVSAVIDTAGGGHVSKNESNSKSQYEKTTFLYPAIKDTNVFNFYNSFPQPASQPYAVIHETGTNEQSNKSFDSGWYFRMENRFVAFMDSTNKRFSESTKTKETKEPWLSSLGLIILVVGLLVLWEFIKKAANKYRIVKKNPISN